MRFDLGVYVNKQNLSQLGHRKPALTMHAKRVSLVRILVQRHNWANCKQGETVTNNGDRYRAMLNEFLFTKIEEVDIGYIWFQQDSATWHTAEATLDVFALLLKIALSAAELMSFGHLGAAI